LRRPVQSNAVVTTTSRLPLTVLRPFDDLLYSVVKYLNTQVFKYRERYLKTVFKYSLKFVIFPNTSSTDLIKLSVIIIILLYITIINWSIPRQACCTVYW